ncbi:site-specific integrase [Nocardioides sp.]|uniref:tyrosine-type recombinase/integrase n=1 Tax=Nocardioides sp. TaxID=35761 RepID=UPI002E310C90|nr:site-specific integrase [Nocardioides sp.]
MVSVVRDGNSGSWLARWRDPSGRQRKKSFARKTDAQRWVDQMQAARHRGQYIDPRAATVRIEDIAGTWETGLIHLKESTAFRYRGVLRLHVLPRFGSWQLNVLRRSDIQAWVSDLVSAGLAPGTVRQCHRVLSLLIDSAVADGRLAANPAHGVKLPRLRRGEPRFLSPSEVTALIAAAGEHGLSVAVLALCGLRFGELAALRVRDVDLPRRRLTIAGSVTEVGGRTVWSDPKSHRVRSVPFSASLTPFVEDRTRGRLPDDLLITSPEGSVLRLRNWRTRVFDPAARAIGRTDITPHDLRHTAASLAIKSGANVKAVQQMLGHASAAMTLDVYAGLFPDDLDAVGAALGELVHTPSIPPPRSAH